MISSSDNQARTAPEDASSERPADAARQRRRRSDAALNAQRLLDAARTQLAADPDVSVGSIAAAAGVSRGTAYRHYPTRERLLAAVREQAREEAEAGGIDSLRPAGELAHVLPTPLSIADVLNKVPPFQIGDQLVAEAQRIVGVTSAAVYLIDLAGGAMQRLAGSPAFPEQLPVPLAVGPELPREGIEPLRASLADVMPGITCVPMFLRGRAVGVLLAVGSGDDMLRDLANEAAAAISLATSYTDRIDQVRRVKQPTPAAELQQQLLPPRIVRVSGAGIAGNVLPGYDIGGDWFDYAENPDCTWIGLADAEGVGIRASGLAAVLLGAFRAARHAGGDPADVVELMHRTLSEVTDEVVRATATIATWSAPTRLLRWISCGDLTPVLLHADGRLELLDQGRVPHLGDPGMPDRAEAQQRRLETGQRVLMMSDGVLGRRTADGGTLGLEGVRKAASKALNTSAPATLRAIEDALREAVQDPLDDDATLVVLAPTP